MRTSPAVDLHECTAPFGDGGLEEQVPATVGTRASSHSDPQEAEGRLTK